MVTAFPAPIDFEADGKQFGHITIPHSRHDSAWGSILIPILCVKNGTGPTVLLTGGNHGDEYEGPVALMKLARTLEPGRVQGRVIVVPALNVPAVLANRRTSPIDGGNLNRLFPGDPRGSPTQRIAHYVQTELLPRADVVVDLHSGGSSLDFVPTVVMHALPNPDMHARTLAALQAFGAPIGLVLEELDAQGMMDSAAEDMGKLFLSTELGGGATLTPERVAIAERGVANLLAHFGLVEGPAAEPAPATRVMCVPDTSWYVLSRADGIFEPLVDLGAAVTVGQVLAQVHDPADPLGDPAPHHAGQSGTVVAKRAMARCTLGDSLFVLAENYPNARESAADAD